MVATYMPRYIKPKNNAVFMGDFCARTKENKESI